jgi:hypothetical protein
MQGQAQVGVNLDNSDPHPSAGLDIKFTDKGFLPPRVALAATDLPDPVTAPATGLLVYNTAAAGTPPNNVTPGYYYWSGSAWVTLASSPGTNPGDMLYWNGTQWLIVPVGTNGQVLTLSGGVPIWGGTQLPIVSTKDITAITAHTATTGGIISSDGGIPVTASGVCFGTTPNPTLTGDHTTDGKPTGSFTSLLTGLTEYTQYYVRAYATNSSGTSYGNEVVFSTVPYVVGLHYGGGVIFYVDGSGYHGLIAAESDCGDAPWGCVCAGIATSSAIGTGQANTAAIIAGCGESGIAARLCDELVVGEFDDWYLPSVDELYQLSLQNSFVGGFVPTWYWSSTQPDACFAYFVVIYTNWVDYAIKNQWHRVRAIRAF